MHELEKKITGKVLTPAPADYHRDFGNIAQKSPKLLIVPARTEDVQVAVEYANRNGMRIVSRGHGCSSHGQSLSDQLLLDTRELHSIELVSADIAMVGAGCSWGRFQEYLVSKGLSSKVIVSNDRATIGGTLSVGGFGPSSLYQGAVADQVVSLDIVTGTGELIRAEAQGAYQELFNYTLCGLGQTGVITAVQMRLEPYKPFTMIETRFYPASVDLDRLAQSIADERCWNLCRVMYVNSKERWKVELGRNCASSTMDVLPGARVARDYFREIFAKEANFTVNLAAAQVRSGLLPSTEGACKIWSDFFLPSCKASDFFTEVKPLFREGSRVMGFNGAILCRGQKNEVRLPLMPVPESDLVQSMGPYCVVSPELVSTYLSHFDRATQVCQDLGGRQYLYGYHTCAASFYRRQFGSATFSRWIAVKNQYDPGNILGPLLF